MHGTRTQAIVLKRQDFSEADRLATILTPDLGKVKAIVKGARKPLSKLAGHLEPFSLTKCQLHEGKTFFTVTGAEIISPFVGIRESLGKTSQAYYYLEMVDALTGEAEEHAVLFWLLKDALTHLESTGETQERLLRTAFTLRLLANLGFLPELGHCVNCHAQLKPEENVFSLALGGILGPECKKADLDPITLSGDSIKVMRILLDQSFAIVNRLTLKPAIQHELERIVESYLHYQMGRAMRSVGFVRDIQLGTAP
jgi:DNA repair protein RecO (recombination protein O)